MEKIRFGMVGGGNGGFIGNVHRKGALMDDLAVLRAGCFSRNEEKNKETARQWGIEEESRVYGDFREMAEKESSREDGIEFVIIATPNHTHYEIAKCFMEKGIHIVCDKPLALDLAQGEELEQMAKEKNLLFAVTYTYTGYAMIRQARDLIDRGEIGKIITIMGEFPSEWQLLQMNGGPSEQATWRMDPSKSGPSGCCADIGTHVECLIEKMTGLKIKRVLAKLEKLPEGAGLPLENNVQVLAEFDNGASGMIWTSQVAVGCETDIAVRVFGDKGALEWSHRTPAVLKVTRINEPPQIYTPARDYTTQGCRDLSRLPSGHPEGFYEAFANIYRGFLHALLERKGEETGQKISFPTVSDGLRGIRFVEACLKSNEENNVWVNVD